MLILLGKKNGPGEDTQEHTASAQAQETSESPRQELRKSIKSLIWAIGLAAYFIVSFSTGAWYVTWVIFPIIGAVQGLVIACLDLTEGHYHENHYRWPIDYSGYTGLDFISSAQVSAEVVGAIAFVSEGGNRSSFVSLCKIYF